MYFRVLWRKQFGVEEYHQISSYRALATWMNTECPNDDNGRAIKECYKRLREPRKKEAIAHNRVDRVWGFIEELEEKDKEKRGKDEKAAEILRYRSSRTTRSNMPKSSKYFLSLSY